MTPERKYNHRAYVHVFVISVDKGICFYSTADCLVWFTLFCVLAARYKVRVLAVCIMLNHFHIEARFHSKQSMSAFMRELGSRFTRQYNSHYRLSGPLFRERYGSSLKMKEQLVKDNFVYVCNNPIGKKAVRKAEQYRWNFLAYMESGCPFSSPIVIRKSSRRFLCVRAEVLQSCRKGQPLGYTFFGGLYDQLSVSERKQIVDLIVSSYNVIDYEELRRVWGGLDRICEMLHTVSGSEYDLADDNSSEDYRHYYQMIRIVGESGFDIRCKRFVDLPEAEAGRLAAIIASRTDATIAEIAKFLHLPLSELIGKPPRRNVTQRAVIKKS